MSQEITIKERTTKSGKTKYQADVWYDNKFYGSKSFDIRHLAVAYKVKQLELAIKGTLKPASERRAERKANAELEQPMTYWAGEYISNRVGDHGDTRYEEYDLVGRLLATKSLRDFHGKAGAQLIQKLSVDWKTDRRPRRKSPSPNEPHKPLKPNTVRLRLSALARLVRYAASRLPANVSFTPPDFDSLFEFKLPPAYSQPRTRLPSDDEYCRLLEHFGPMSEFGDMLRVIDETGCRVGEVRDARAEDVVFTVVDGQVIGGHLILHHHKTDADVGVRKVPLSLFAAQTLHRRVPSTGSGLLLPSLFKPKQVFKSFDGAREALGIVSLQMKDFRRAFINRNKYSVPRADLVTTIGNSSLLSGIQSANERGVQLTAGHTDMETTDGYNVPHLERLSLTYSQTSRWPRTQALLTQRKLRSNGQEIDPPSDTDGPANRLQQIQRELAAGLVSMAAQGESPLAY